MLQTYKINKQYFNDAQKNKYFLMLAGVLFFAFSSRLAFNQAQTMPPKAEPDALPEVTAESLMAQKPEVNPADYQKIAVNHAKKADDGLALYRAEASREDVVQFYTHITGSRTVAESILAGADSYDIPVSLAFSLAYVESRYKERAVNHNRNSTIDRGLFQLNSNSFAQLSEEEFFDPKTNAKHGLSHLRFCLDTAGNEISALAMYNAGANKVKKGSTPQVTLDYVSKVVDYRAGLDALFAQEIVAKAGAGAETFRLASIK